MKLQVTEMRAVAKRQYELAYRKEELIVATIFMVCMLLMFSILFAMGTETVDGEEITTFASWGIAIATLAGAGLVSLAGWGLYNVMRQGDYIRNKVQEIVDEEKKEATDQLPMS